MVLAITQYPYTEAEVSPTAEIADGDTGTTPCTNVNADYSEVCVVNRVGSGTILSTISMPFLPSNRVLYHLINRPLSCPLVSDPIRPDKDGRCGTCPRQIGSDRRYRLQVLGSRNMFSENLYILTSRTVPIDSIPDKKGQKGPFLQVFVQ